MARFSYLPYIIPLMMGELIVIMTLFWLFHKKYLTCQRCNAKQKVGQQAVGNREIVACSIEESHDPNHVRESSILDDHFHDAVLENYTFNSTFRPGCRSPPVIGRLLFILRLAFMFYVVGIGNIWHLEDSQGWQYFTNWNMFLVGVYYTLAVSVSVIGMLFDSPDVEWSKAARQLGNITHVLFEVGGSCSFFITVVAFVYLNPETKFWNVTVHLVTTLSFVVEMALNSMYVRFNRYVNSLTWILIYMIFIWTYVASKTKEWPYDFLDTSSASCFIWYEGLLLAHFLFYCLWYGMSRLKQYYYQLHPNLRQSSTLLRTADQLNVAPQQVSQTSPNWHGDGHNSPFSGQGGVELRGGGSGKGFQLLPPGS